MENRNLTAFKFTQVDHKGLISMTDILKTLSDDKALVLFNTIALANGESEIQIRKMGLTTKQYYSRISKMINANLIRRKNGRYSLTLLGKIVYEAHMTIGKGSQLLLEASGIRLNSNLLISWASKRRDIQISRNFDR